MKKIDFGQDLAGIGNRMRQVRDLSGLSQGRMARIVGIDNQSTYGNYEAGRSVPLDFVIHYHNVCYERLGIRFALDWLLKGVGEGPQRGPAPGAAAGGAAVGAERPVGQDPADLSPNRRGTAEARFFDERIAEHMARSTEVLEGLLKRKLECSRQAAGDPPVHPFLNELPFLVMDMMSVIRYASPGACRLFKTTAEAAVGQSSMRYGKTAFEEVVPEQIEATLTRGYWIGEVEAQTSRFESLPVVMIMWLMQDKENNPCLGVVVVPKSQIDAVLGDLKSLGHDTVKAHVAWEKARVPDTSKSSPPE